MTGTIRRSDGEKPSAVRSTRTVDRALKLFTAVIEESTGGTLVELARATDLSPSTAGRLLATLVQHQLVRRDETSLYKPGLRIKQIAAATLREEPLYELAGPHLVELADETGETASLGIAIEGDQVLYLRQVASRRLVQTATWTGRTIPRRSTALGKALDRELERDGYVTSRRRDSDIVAVAAPVFGHHGEIVGAISINSPAYRTSEEDVSRFGRSVVEHAEAMSLTMGASARTVD